MTKFITKTNNYNSGKKKEYLNSIVIIHFIVTSFDFFTLDRKCEIHWKKFTMFFKIYFGLTENFLF